MLFARDLERVVRSPAVPEPDAQGSRGQARQQRGEDRIARRARDHRMKGDVSLDQLLDPLRLTHLLEAELQVPLSLLVDSRRGQGGGGRL